MNLDDAKVTIIGPPPPEADASQAETIKVDSDEVFEGDEDDASQTGKCVHCGMENAKPLPNGTCDICGNVWETEDDSEFQIALELLQSSTNVLTKLLKNQKAMKKVSYRDENEARSLVVTIDDFLDTYDFTDTNNT